VAVATGVAVPLRAAETCLIQKVDAETCDSKQMTFFLQKKMNKILQPTKHQTGATL